VVTFINIFRIGKIIFSCYDLKNERNVIRKIPLKGGTYESFCKNCFYFNIWSYVDYGYWLCADTGFHQHP